MSYPRIDVITLPMKNGAFLGISVVGHDGGIFVSDIVKDGAVALDGRIEVGDQIIQVNRTSFEDLTDDQAVKLLRQAAVSRRPVTLYVAKRPFNGDYQSDVFSGLASETLPIDVSLWVKTTQQTNVKPLKPFAIDDSSMMNGEVIMEEDNDTDVEGAYLERKNGFVGAVARINTAKSRIPEPALASTHIYSAEDVARRRENEENEQLVDTLNVNMDPTTILKYMARPDSGLQIKNRKWLKIPVPMSFIGREFVDWLMEHVHGISDRKEARIFAAKLLAEGHIRHVVNKLTFTEKCYYVFEDSILSVRNNNTTDSSSGKTGAEATTEVTYVGSPAPAIPVRPNKCNGNVRQPPATNVSTMIDQTWPLSPITVYGPPPRRSDCESPMTNDYASMIGPEVQSSAFMAMATEAPTLKLPHFPANPHTNAIRMRPDDDHQVPQPPNTPSAMSIIQRTAACEASETDFEVVDDDRRRIVREEK
ncbi:hypothetical protein AB6A40_002915 [Gnathostoma spinigerum]|uniref:Dishevelled n=1 Tax=Gnathostoma spinigerum TaxID=75299 RepID=A0ABD6E9A4_9BILA